MVLFVIFDPSFEYDKVILTPLSNELQATYRVIRNAAQRYPTEKIHSLNQVQQKTYLDYQDKV